jgi:hypothetical protein
VREDGSAHSLKAPKCRRTSLSHNPEIYPRQRVSQEREQTLQKVARQVARNRFLVQPFRKPRFYWCARGGLELPTFWFVAEQGQNLSACSGVAYGPTDDPLTRTTRPI